MTPRRVDAILPRIVLLLPILSLGLPSATPADEPNPADPPRNAEEASAESRPNEEHESEAEGEMPGGEESRTSKPGSGPRILTAREASDLLRPPGESGYPSEAIDWRNVPAWQQTRFFGLRARGRVFAFVVDCSGSMADDFRLLRAKQELKRCIASLQFPQRYYIVFYNDRALPMPGGLPRSTDHRARRSTYAWLDRVQAEGPTDPKPALDVALSLRPDAVFLLSDGQYPPGTPEAVRARNTGKVPIHTIDLAGGAASAHLRTIAEQSGGRYAARP